MGVTAHSLQPSGWSHPAYPNALINELVNSRERGAVEYDLYFLTHDWCTIPVWTGRSGSVLEEITFLHSNCGYGLLPRLPDICFMTFDPCTAVIFIFAFCIVTLTIWREVCLGVIMIRQSTVFFWLLSEARQQYVPRKYRKRTSTEDIPPSCGANKDCRSGITKNVVLRVCER